MIQVSAQNIICLAGGILYGFLQFFLTSRVTKAVLSSDVLRAGVFLLVKLFLYAGLVLFVLFYDKTGIVWFIGGYGGGICLPAFIYVVIMITKKGDGDGGKRRNN